MPALALLLAASLAALPVPPPPPTPVRPASDVHHRVKVVDLYRWLERADDPEVQAWTKVDAFVFSQLAVPYRAAAQAPGREVVQPGAVHAPEPTP